MTGRTVYLLQHVHEFEDGHEDVKLIGVYSSEELAMRAQKDRANQPGFCELPDRFEISKHVVDDDRDEWSEGFFTTQ